MTIKIARVNDIMRTSRVFRTYIIRQCETAGVAEVPTVREIAPEWDESAVATPESLDRCVFRMRARGDQKPEAILCDGIEALVYK